MGTESNNGASSNGTRPAWLLSDQQRAELAASQVPIDADTFRPPPAMTPEAMAVATVTAQLLSAALPPPTDAEHGVLTRLEAIQDGCIGTAALMAGKIVQAAKEIIV